MCSDTSMAAIVARRANALDYILCAIRDCFVGPAYGSIVQSEGVDACARQRSNASHFGKFRQKQRADHSMLHVAPERLIQALESYQQFLPAATRHLATEFRRTSIRDVHYEQLAAFQYNRAAVNASAAAWLTLLRAWHVRPRKSTSSTAISTIAQSVERLPDRTAVPYTIWSKCEVAAVLRRAGQGHLIQL